MSVMERPDISGAPGRVFMSHSDFDWRTAVEHGPGDGAACVGVLDLIGDDADPVLLAQCRSCGCELGVRRSVVERLEREPQEREERWYQR